MSSRRLPAPVTATITAARPAYGADGGVILRIAGMWMLMSTLS